MNMQELPVDVICHGILPHLSARDLQALDTAFTNDCLRPQLRQVWKSYQYDSLLEIKYKAQEIIWLCTVGVQIISLKVGYHFAELESVITEISSLKRLIIKAKVSDSTLLQFASNCHHLEELSVSYVGGSNTDNAVSALAQNCRQLHTLHIGSEDLTDAGMITLVKYTHQLQNFRVCTSKITDAGIQELCDNCPHLNYIGLLHCRNLTDASLIAIGNSYPHLQSIEVGISLHFTDDGLIYIADKFHELRTVSVRCYNITSRGLTALWAANPNLMDVDISFNRFISDDDIIQLLQCCPLLQELNISDCFRITDAAVIAVAEHCPQLRSLTISRCNKISDASLIALGQYCHELKSINISVLENISDVGIAALATGCPLLQEFYASYTNITDDGVVALARGCRDLRIIDLTLCEPIDEATVSAIVQYCPLISEVKA